MFSKGFELSTLNFNTLFVLRESRRKETRRKESTNSNIFSFVWMQRKAGRKD
jgi:hypothetical protein